ncbi:CHAP domain-containing protein [Acidobacteriota bacterium]
MSKPVLRMHSLGEAVEELTTLLVERGYLQTATQTFDRLVRMAVKEFQARHVDERGVPLVVDGVVGPVTWWALQNPDNTDILEQPIPEKLKSMPETGGSPRGRAALETALSEMEAGAKEVDSNNSGPWVEKYLNNIAPTPANWCAGFVSWCYAQHPDGIPYTYTVGARATRSKFKTKDWLYDVSENSLPQPGDIIVWWRDQPTSWKGHIGLVHSLSEGGILYTVEGNKGGFPAPVRVFDYVLGRIDKLLGFGRVPEIV